MAINLQSSSVLSIGAIVESALAATKKVKARELAKKESDFQTAVASGNMTYEAQVAFRNAQIEAEKNSSFPDEDYIATVQRSVNDLVKLNRFSKYREKYLSSNASLKAGKESATEHLNILTNLLSNTTDPDLREEIMGNIVSAQDEVRTSNNNIIANQVKKAQYDGTTGVLSDAIKNIQNKKALAELNGNQEEASAYDVTLTVLNQQKNQVEVADKLDKLDVANATKGLTAMDRVNSLNSEISSADATTPFTIDGKTYASMQAYWTGLRDNYLAGNGKGVLADFMGDLKTEYDNKLSGAISRDGFAASPVLDSIKNDLTAVSTRPEFQPFLSQLKDLTDTTLATALDSTARKIVANSDNSGDFKSGADAIAAYSTKYGIDLSAYSLDLSNKMVNQINSVASANKEAPADVAARAGLTDVLPASDFKIPTPTSDVKKTVATPTPTPTRQFTSTETAQLSAAKARIDAGTGSSTDRANVDYASKQGWSSSPSPSVTPVTPPTPVVAPTTSTAPEANTTVPTAPVVAPVQKAPAAAAPAPAPAKAPTSIVDYLKLQNKDSSFSSRTALATANGITGYTGTAEQNNALLKKLQGV